MDIQFTEEQELLRSSIQRLLRDQYDFDARRKIVASEDGFSRNQWEAFAALGLFAAPFSEDVGGLGGGPLSTMIIMQEFGRHLVVEPLRSGRWPGPRRGRASTLPMSRPLRGATVRITS